MIAGAQGSASLETNCRRKPAKYRKTQLVCDIILTFPKVNGSPAKLAMIIPAKNPARSSGNLNLRERPRAILGGCDKILPASFQQGSAHRVPSLLRRVLAESPYDSHDLRKKAIVVESNSLSHQTPLFAASTPTARFQLVNGCTNPRERLGAPRQWSSSGRPPALAESSG
jgi:hypothetical protein